MGAIQGGQADTQRLGGPGLTEPPLLTCLDLARLLQCSTRKVRGMVLTGALPRPAIDQPRFKRWRSHDIQRCIAGERARQ